jgi:tRNA nucleotidyltransferase (CCA-adding enzyme)
MPDFFIPNSEKELTNNVHIINFALEKLPPQIEELVSFIDTINDKAKSYLVGGSVRDSILSAKTGIDFQMKDFDLEVYGVEHADLVSSLIARYGSKNVDPETGKSFRIIKLRVEGIPDKIDIALPRTERKAENVESSSTRGRGIEPFPDPYLDQVTAVKRRDLTINSILYDPVTEQIIDPYGGWYDLMNGVLKITDPETFKEDPLRVLRVAQFGARFGFKIHEDTINFCREIVSIGETDSLPRDRVYEELDKLIVKGYTPSLGLKFLKEIGYLEKIMPELCILESIPQEPKYHPEGDAFTHTMQVVDAMAEIIRKYKKIFSFSPNLIRALMLGALFHDLGKATTTVIHESGRISSTVHEEEGVVLADNVIKRIYKSENQQSDIEFQEITRFLIKYHMIPVNLYSFHLKGFSSAKSTFDKLRKELNLDLGMLLYLEMIVEADKRGRNSEDKNKPLEIENLPELQAALGWFHENIVIAIDENKAKTEIDGKKIVILDTDKLKEILVKKGLRSNGVWLGIIKQCVEDDYLEDVIPLDESMNRALYYFEKMFSNVDLKQRMNDWNFWNQLKEISDPREFLKNLTK